MSIIWLFGDKCELLLWRNGVDWQARLISDRDGDGVEKFDESYLLWGTYVEDMIDGFSLLSHGAEGFYHALPLQIMAEENVPAHIPNNLSIFLQIRHYLDYDKDGQAYILTSRLAGLQAT